MNIGETTDKLYKLIQKRKAVQLKVKEMKAEEEKLVSAVFKMFSSLSLMRASGKVANVSIKKQVVPTITNHDKFFNFAKLKANIDLLTIGVSSQAWRERFDEGKKIPGTKSFTKISLSVTKKRK